MGLMELGCKLEAFGRLAQPAASNRLRCWVLVVSERYLVRLSRVCLLCLFVCGFITLFFGVGVRNLVLLCDSVYFSVLFVRVEGLVFLFFGFCGVVR